MKRKIMISSLTGLLCALLCTQFLGTPFIWQIWLARQDSIQYLEGKYDEPFTVGLPRVWVMDGTFHVQASPKARPDIVFFVGTEQGRDGISDHYEKALRDGLESSR